MIEDVKKKILDWGEWFFGLPDSFEKEWQRKALYIIYDLGLLFVAFVFISGMMGSGPNPLKLFSVSNITAIGNTLRSPSPMTLMGLPMMGGALGLGLSFLIQDCLPKKCHSAVAKVMAVAAPFLLVAGATCIILATGHATAGAAHLSLMGYPFSFTNALLNRMTYLGLLLFPLGFLVAARSIKTIKNA